MGVCWGSISEWSWWVCPSSWSDIGVEKEWGLLIFIVQVIQVAGHIILTIDVVFHDKKRGSGDSGKDHVTARNNDTKRILEPIRIK